MSRYNRQISLSQIGDEGQHRLARARVLVVGAGGLGCPVLSYLAGAGVGCMGIVDGDVVSLTNLHRQLLYSQHDIGYLKAEKAAAYISKLNDECEVKIYPVRLTNVNAWEIVPAYDIVVDCTDNMPAHYMINDICVLLQKPLVYAGLYRFEGQLSVFNYGNNPINYRDIFPVQPGSAAVCSCNDAGVLGPLPGILGSMQAMEVMKLITGAGEVASNKLLLYYALHNSLTEMKINPSLLTNNEAPKDKATFLLHDYKESNVQLVDAVVFDQWKTNTDTLVLDVRKEAVPLNGIINYIWQPLEQLDEKIDLSSFKRVLVICQRGVRSKSAVAILNKYHKNVYSLEGGVESWLNSSVNTAI